MSTPDAPTESRPRRRIDAGTEETAWTETGPAPAGAPRRGTSGLADLWALLCQRSFASLFAAHFVSNLGDWLAFLALFSLTAFEWHAGVLGVSILSIAYVLPTATVAPLAGVFVDRWDLRRVLVWSDLVRCGLVLLMVVSPSLWIMCVLLFLHQAVSCFFNPAQSAALPRLVARPRLLAANALTTQAAHLTKLLGPAVAGLLVAALGPRSCFYADAASFALSAALLATLAPLPSPARAARGARAVWTDLVAGLWFLRRARRVRYAVTMVALSMVALGAFVALVSVYARDLLGAGPRLMGALLSTIGGGTVAGAFVVVHTGKRWRKTYSIAAGVLVLGGALLLLAAARGAPLAFMGAFFLGLAGGAIVVPAQAEVQEQTPQEILGRVQSSAVAGISLAQIGSMAIAGPAAHLLGMAPLFVGLAVFLFAAILATALVGARHRIVAAHRARRLERVRRSTTSPS